VIAARLEDRCLLNLILSEGVVNLIVPKGELSYLKLPLRQEFPALFCEHGVYDDLIVV
jgi:hypothetical protein